jgi:hypothetical protein
MTDGRLLSGPERAAFTETETWQFLRIVGEFVEG